MSQEHKPPLTQAQRQKRFRQKRKAELEDLRRKVADASRPGSYAGFESLKNIIAKLDRDISRKSEEIATLRAENARIQSRLDEFMVVIREYAAHVSPISRKVLIDRFKANGLPEIS